MYHGVKLYLNPKFISKYYFNSLSAIHINITIKITAMHRNKFCFCHKTSNLVYVKLHNVQLGTFVLTKPK